jgi:hypothetical protein
MKTIKEDGTAHCSKCDRWKEVTENFYKNKKEGYGSYCKQCTKLSAVEWQVKNPDKKKKSDAATGLKARTKRRAERESLRLSGVVVPHHNKGRRHAPRNPGFPIEVLIDDEDFVILGHHSWSLSGNGYIQRHVVKDDGTYTKVRLHREIMGFPDCEVDHINGNRLDNRRNNLRLASSRINNENKSLKGQGKSGHLGVSWRADMGKWYAYAKMDGKPINLGFYCTKDEAAEVARQYRIAHYNGFTDRQD